MYWSEDEDLVDVPDVTIPDPQKENRQRMADIDKARKRTQRGVERMKELAQAKGAPRPGQFSKNGLTFTDNWANELIGGKALATTTPQSGVGKTSHRQNDLLGPWADEFMGLTSTGGPKATTPQKDIRQKELDLGAKEQHHRKNLGILTEIKNPKFLNDGFIGVGTKGPWRSVVDDNIYFGPNTIRSSVTLKVGGPIRLEPTSVTSGLDSAWVSIDWYGLDEKGQAIPEIRPHQKSRQHSILGGYNEGLGAYDFAPPYLDLNPNGYLVTITKPAQFDSHGNPFGMMVDVYSQDGDRRVKRWSK